MTSASQSHVELTEATRADIVAFVETMKVPSQGTERFLDGLHEDYAITICGRTPFSGTYVSKAAFIEKLWANFSESLEIFPGVKMVQLIVDGDWACMMFNLYGGKLKTGDPYEQEVCWIIQIKEGKISRCFEFIDTAHVMGRMGVGTEAMISNDACTVAMNDKSAEIVSSRPYRNVETDYQTVTKATHMTITKYLDSLDTPQTTGDSWLAPMDDQYILTITGSTPFSGTYESKAFFVEHIWSNLTAAMEIFPGVKCHRLLVEGEYASMICELYGGRLKSGKAYEMSICWTFQVKDDKIIRGYEFFDSAYVMKQFTPDDQAVSTDTKIDGTNAEPAT